jgi:hypothetical protein
VVVLEHLEHLLFFQQLQVQEVEVEVQEEIHPRKLDYLEDLEVEDLEMEDLEDLEILRQLVHHKEIMEQMLILHSRLEQEVVEPEEQVQEFQLNFKEDLEEQVQQIQLQTHLLLELVEEVEVHFNQEEEVHLQEELVDQEEVEQEVRVVQVYQVVVQVQEQQQQLTLEAVEEVEEMLVVLEEMEDQVLLLLEDHQQELLQ